MIFKHFLLSILLSLSNGQQLPTGLTVYHYALHLIFSEDTFTTSPYNYKGELQIRFALTGNYPSDVKLHASKDFIRIDEAGLEVFNASVVPITQFEIDDEDVLTLGGTQIANTTLYTSVLYINYTSRLSTEDLYGLYRAEYTTNEAITNYMVASQLEPTFARRVFPCIDEPTGKTTFKLNVTHPPNVEVYFNSAANFTEEGTTESTTYFLTTGVMAPYMVGLSLANDLECTVGENFTYGTVYYYRVCSSPGTADSRQWAVDVGPTIMDTLYNITNFEYGLSMGFPKMDVMALPILGTGASEIWGLVTFREENILYDSVDSDSLKKQTITETMAYEFAQIWLGNVASPELWNYLYLTKGLAYYLRFLVVDQIFPDWKVTSQFLFRVMQPSLRLDALEATASLRAGANSTAEILGKFDLFNVLKSASLYRMLNEVIAGYPSFRLGIEYFLTSFSFRNSQPQGLWNLIAAQINLDNRDRLPSETYLKNVLIAWETNPGYPLLTVSIEDGLLKIKQQGRFLYTGTDDSYSWYVPVNYVFSSNTTGFDNTTVSHYVLPVGDGLEVPLPTEEEEDWVVVNIQAAGYYRVHYSGVLWSKLASALKQPQFSDIPELNRAQLIDDAFELARANYLNYSDAFELLSYIAEEEALSPWMTALNQVNYLLRRVGHASTLGLKITSLILTHLSKMYSGVLWSVVDDEDQAYSVKQMMILDSACKLGYLDCVKNAKSLFSTFVNSGTKPHKNQRLTVYCTALMYGGVTSYWDTLVATYRSTDVAAEKVRILQVLGCSENEDLLHKSLDLSLDESVKPQDAHVVFQSVYQSSSLGAKLALDFLISNYTNMAQRYQSMNALRKVVLDLAEHLTDAEHVTSFKTFLQTTSDLPEEIQLVAEQAIEITEINDLWLNDHQDELKEYFNVSD